MYTIHFAVNFAHKRIIHAEEFQSLEVARNTWDDIAAQIESDRFDEREPTFELLSTRP